MSVRGTLGKLSRAQDLFNAGEHAAVVAYLGEHSANELRQSPTLALLFGISAGRLGQYDTGREWVGVALEQARKTGDGRVEARALNVLGAIAFESGRIDEAAMYFERTMSAAKELDDQATMGKCANNLGIIANLRGDHLQAITSFTRALAAFDLIASRRGMAETVNNMSISYRDLGQYDRALDAVDRAVHHAEATGDMGLVSQIRAGRAEIRLRAGDTPMARRDIEAALEAHTRIRDRIGQAEDRRVLALTLDARGETDRAVPMLKQVIAEANDLGRPLLAASAGRDLAEILFRRGQYGEARDAARNARSWYQSLGALAELRKLDALLTTS